MPLFRVAVAVEDDRAVLGVHLLQHLLDRLIQRLAGADAGFQLGRDVVERVGHDRVQDRDRDARGLARTDGAELEAVAGEGERAGAIAVARVTRQVRQRIDADLQLAAGLGRLGAAGLDLLPDVVELLAHEDRDDRGRGFVGAQAVIVAGRGDGGAQQAAELVHRADDRAAEHQELRVVVRRRARIEQVALGAVAERVVQVLARAVDARERLLVQEAHEVVLLGDRFSVTITSC